MAEKRTSMYVGMEIQRMLVQELGSFGSSIFRKQCDELKIKIEQFRNDVAPYLGGQ